VALSSVRWVELLDGGVFQIAPKQTSVKPKRENGTRSAFPVSRFACSLMEARGIEPRSEHDSETAPTCVDLALWSHHLGAWSALAVTSL
jgi:hypothetical protein